MKFSLRSNIRIIICTWTFNFPLLLIPHVEASRWGKKSISWDCKKYSSIERKKTKNRIKLFPIIIQIKKLKTLCSVKIIEILLEEQEDKKNWWKMALWNKLLQSRPEVMEQIRVSYGNHFPMEVRHYLCDWLESRLL